MMYVEQSVELTLVRETEVHGENLLQATSSTTNLTLLYLGWNPGLRDGKPVTNRLNYGTAHQCYQVVVVVVVVVIPQFFLFLATQFG
jgi:hypothetical protein